MRYQTYVFDLDGTLLDTLGDLAASTNYALRTHGMPEHSLDDVRRFVGNGVRVLMERAVPQGAENPQFEAAFQTFRTHYMQHSLDTTKPYDGILIFSALLLVRSYHICLERGSRNRLFLYRHSVYRRLHSRKAYFAIRLQFLCDILDCFVGDVIHRYTVALLKQCLCILE